MTVTLEGSVQVDRGELRAALKAVRPHAGPNRRGDEVLPLHRVRLHIGAGRVHVLAASGASMAVAYVGILADTRPHPEHADDGPYLVDLDPNFVDYVLKVFPARKLRKDADPQDGRIEIKFGTHEVEFEEGPGGLYEGQRIGFPIADPNSQFPDVRALVGRAVRERGETTQAKPLVVGGAILQLWHHAGQAYGQPVRISGSGDVTSPTYVVEVGGLFVGTFGSRPGDDIARKQQSVWAQGWLEDLPTVDEDALAEAERLLGAPAAGEVDEPDDGQDELPEGDD